MDRLRIARLAALLLASTIGAGAQSVSLTPSMYPVTGNLSSIAGSSSDLLQARFSLVNCGTAIPTVGGITLPVVWQKVFTANVSGNIAGQLWGNDSISCNGAATTLYQVVYLRNNVPTGTPLYYRITGSTDLTVATPVTVLPPTVALAQGIKCPTGSAMAGILSNFNPVCNSFVGPTGPQGPTGPSALGFIDVTTFPGAPDLALQIAAADAAFIGSPANFIVPQSGNMMSPFTLHQLHNLHVAAPVTGTSAAIITLAGSNKISCSGPGASITSAVASATGIFTTSGTVDTVVFSGCTFNGISGTVPYIFAVTNPVSNLTMTDVHGINATIFNLFNRTAQSKNLSFTDISSVCTSSCGGQGIYLNGWYNGVRVSGSYWENLTNGVYPAPIFIATSKPSLADIQAANGYNLDVDNIHCLNMGQTCVFTSGAYKVTVQNGTADGCGDICFDAEGSAFVQYGPGLIVEHGGNSLINLAYSTGYWNSARGNTLISHGENVIMTNNDGGLGATSFIQSLAIDGNTITCLGASVSSALALDATQFTSFTDNKLTDCALSYRDYQQQITISHNQFHYTKAFTGAGLLAPPALYGGPNFITFNRITTDVNQTGACFAQNNNDFNAYDTFFFTSNLCPALSPGQWATTASLRNDGTNSGVGVLWRFTDNEFPNISAFTNTGSNANSYITRKGNCAADTSSGPVPPLCDATP
jgi:hypothetical protein